MVWYDKVMKKLFALLLLAPIMYAKEYNFKCTSVKKLNVTTGPLTINTKEKYIIFSGSRKYLDDWKETEVSIEAKRLSESGSSKEGGTLTFDKITGYLTWYEFSDIPSDPYVEYSYYNCVPTKRLMP
jgi:hypothetical protein